ncbi:hypothetical protein BVRB_8g182970 isoform B [Beta vulgaris subsp. vulgaris]|nr:hypothetical protein BVRB_8g182970 isoform B [Beta vulgaris subsp. vulgaris]
MSKVVSKNEPNLRRVPSLPTSNTSPFCYYPIAADDTDSIPVPFFIENGNGNGDNYTGSSAMTPEKVMKQLYIGAFEADDGIRKQWTVKRHDDAVHLMMDLPGVRKEDTKIYVDGMTLMMKGVRKLDPAFKDVSQTTTPKTITYIAAFDLVPMHQYKVAEISAEMNNGVLKVTVPKYKDEERKDVFRIPIN